jgi:hypothetical protein
MYKYVHKRFNTASKYDLQLTNRKETVCQPKKYS